MKRSDPFPPASSSERRFAEEDCRLRRWRRGLARVALASSVAAVSCGSSAPALTAAPSGHQALDAGRGESVTFGSGPLAARRGPVTIASDPSFSAVGLALAEPMLFFNTSENAGHEPGSAKGLASHEFPNAHRGKGLVLRPGERWFIVMSVSALETGRHRVGSVTVAYRADGQRRYLGVPVNVTLSVR
jgi:hypothetical protein